MVTYLALDSCSMRFEAPRDSMALADVGQLDIMGKHVGWTTSKIALQYIKLG